MFKKLLLSGIASLALCAGAEAATVTVVKSFDTAPPLGSTSGSVGEVIQQTTTTAAFTTVQNVATVNLGAGLWRCDGVTATPSTVSNTIQLSINTITGAHPLSTSTLYSSDVIQASAVTTGQSVNTGPAYLSVGPGQASGTAPLQVFLVQTNGASATAVSQLVCVHLK